MKAEKLWLDLWIGEKLGLRAGEKLTREKLRAYRDEKFCETFSLAMVKSPFYNKLYEGLEVTGIEEITKLPFTSPEDLKKSEKSMLCVRQAEVSRIVTLDTSGTEGVPKRVYYTKEDQELTVDFFHHGMQYMIKKGQKALVMMPHERPGSVGDLLAKGLLRLGAAVTFDFEEEDINCIVALPTFLAQLAKKTRDTVKGKDLRESLDTVLLSAEYVSEENKRIIEDAWECRVYEHYGMTEMGLGGAVSCGVRQGCHVRENDLYIEIIDPSTGEVLPDGEKGEIVFTTLTRKAMPFIRYRTGDVSRWIKEPCPCGSVLKRLGKVEDRKIKKGYEVK